MFIRITKKQKYDSRKIFCCRYLCSKDAVTVNDHSTAHVFQGVSQVDEVNLYFLAKLIVKMRVVNKIDSE